MNHLEHKPQVNIGSQITTQVASATWVEVSRSALAHNISQYRTIIGPQRALAVVVKSNAYGHGLLEVSKACDQNDNVDWLCVVSLSEALQLRYAGIQKPLLVLSYIDADPREAVIHEIDLVLYDPQLVQELHAHALSLGKTAYVHVKVDTGLSRVGLVPDEAYALVMQVQALPALVVRGMFTHFAESEKNQTDFVNLQLTRFAELRLRLAQQGIVIPLIHFSCTAALVSVIDDSYTFARFGLGLYGLWPSRENKLCAQERFPAMSLQPVLTWKTKIVQIKRVAAGNFVGYARTFKTVRDSVFAVLPIGYWEGYDRKLSNQGSVLIHNQVAPVVGRISMNITLVDITDIDHAALTVGQEVVLLGAHEAVSADTLAAKTGTISWEVVTRINPLLPRVMVE